MRYTTVLAAAILTAALPQMALAGHGKAGLWKITISVDDTHMGSLSTADQAQLRAKGLDVNSANTLVAERCMSAAEVASNSIAAGASQSPGCSFKDLGMQDQTYRGELVCTQEPKGHGQMRITYDKPEHYTGTMLFSGASGGQAVTLTYRYNGQWVSADCGKVQH